MANPAEIEVAVTAHIEQLQQALQKAESAIKSQAAKIEAIEDRKAKAAEKAQQRAIEAEQKKMALAEKHAQRAIEIENKKQAQLKVIQMKEEQRTAAMMERATQKRQQQALKEIQAQQKAGGPSFDPLAGLGSVARAGGVLAITNLLLDSSQKAADAFAKGAGARGVAESFVTGLYDAIQAVPIAGRITTLFDTLFYGAGREAERKAQEAADKITASLDKAIAAGASKRKDTADILEQTALRQRRAQSSDPAQTETNIELEAIAKKIAAERKIVDKYFKLDLKGMTPEQQDAAIAIAKGEMRLAEQRIAALYEQERVVKEINDQRLNAISREKELVRLAEMQKQIDEKNAKQRLEEDQKLERLKEYNRRNIKETAAFETARKQKELEKLTGVTAVDRQMQMMQSAQASAASMMGSVSTALGEFKFAQQGTGALALAEAKKQTDKAIKIEQLQTDMKTIQENMLRKLESLGLGVS